MRRSLLWSSFVLACVAPARPVPAVAPAGPEVAPPPVAAPPPVEAPPPAEAPPPGPPSLVETATIYDAVIDEEPRDLDGLIGRAQSLMLVPDLRAAAQARADFEAALAQLDPGDPRVGAIQLDYAALLESLGEPALARTHYRRAIALHADDVARKALARVKRKRSRITCKATTPAQALHARTLVEVVARIREAQRVTAPAPANEAEASKLLCSDCITTEPFVARLADDENTVEAHLVVPAADGYWFVPQVAFGNGPIARCPDAVHDASAVRVGNLVHARAVLLLSTMEDACEGDRCTSWCWESQRHELDVVLTMSGGRFVAADRTIAYRTPDEDGDRNDAPLAFAPPVAARLDPVTATVRACGTTHDLEP